MTLVSVSAGRPGEREIRKQNKAPVTGAIESPATAQPFPFLFLSVAFFFLPAALRAPLSLSLSLVGSSWDDGDDDGGGAEAAAAAATLGRAASCGGGVRPGPEVQRRVQLRRLDHGHGQPVHEREADGDHLHAAPLRRDLLRLPHLPLLRRPRHRRLPQHQVWGAVPGPFQGERHGLQAGRQHGHHGGDGHGRPLLPRPRPLRQDLEQRAHQHANPVVPADHGRRVRRRRRLQAVPAGLAGGVRRVRRQRLQRDALRQLQRGAGPQVHDQDRQHHHQGRGEGGGHGGQGRGGARGAPHRLLPHLPHRLRHQQQRRLRRPRLPPQVQRPLHVPQRPAPGQARPPPQALRPGGAHHVRRLLLRRLRHGPEPKQIRIQRGFRGVLRLRGRQVQLRQQREVRDAGRGGVRQPGRPPQLGRHPPHRGRLQAHHRRLAQRALLQPAHPPHLNIFLLYLFIYYGAVVVLLFII